MTVVCVSGHFNPLHYGHVRHFEEAAKLGDLIVILNSDNASIRKHGFSFMPFEERKYIIESLKFVSKVIAAEDEDGTVCKTLIKLRPDKFCKGGDRIKNNTPEVETCGHLGIEMIWGVGGEDKLQASSKLVQRAIESKLISHGIVR